MSRMIFIGDPPPPFFKGEGPEFPDQVLVSLDDEQIKAILLKLGVTFLFNDLPPPRPGTGRGSATGYMITGHPTHWLYFERYQHWPNRADNGYTFKGYPKKTYDKKKLREALGNYWDEALLSGPNFVPWKSGSNRS